MKWKILFEGNELKTSKTGAINSNNGIVLTAELPTGESIKNVDKDFLKNTTINGSLDLSSPM